jgi:hypothetical protein
MVGSSGSEETMTLAPPSGASSVSDSLANQSTGFDTQIVPQTVSVAMPSSFEP